MLFSWGRQSEGQCAAGDENNTQTFPRPVLMPVDDEGKRLEVNWRSVTCAYNRSMAVDAEGNIWSWGTGFMGELGLGYLDHSRLPTKVTKVPPHTSWQVVVAGKEHTLALTGADEFSMVPVLRSDGGLLYSWGANELGQLGHGHSKMLDRPTRVNIDQKFIQIAAGANHSVALSEFGEIYSWGSDYAGQLGKKSELTVEEMGIPQKVDTAVTFKYVACGEHCTAAISNKGELFTWGSGGHGRLGHGNVENVGKPQIVKSVELVNFAQVSCGFNHMLALTETGWVYSWGAGLHGELGNGSRRRQTVPKEIECPEKMKAVVAGYEVSFAVGMSGALYVWGNTEFGTLGNGKLVGILDRPIKVDTNITVKTLVASKMHVLVLGSGKASSPAGWSLEFEKIDPNDPTEKKKVGSDKAAASKSDADEDADFPAESGKKELSADDPDFVPASVKALNTLGVALEDEIFALEHKYGYKQTEAEIAVVRARDEGEALELTSEEATSTSAKADVESESETGSSQADS